MDKRMRCKHVALAVTAAFLPSGQSYALPTGEAVVAGDVTVTRPTAQTMQINQATQKGIVNWLGFSIGAAEHVNITQPSASASLLNRVVGNHPSEIFGRLTANGRVFLVNPNGVLFAPGASVSAASVVASTLSITDPDFINGNYLFSNSGNAGSVVNQGSIVTAGGFTALIGPQVRNDGVIIANSGKVALGAGDRVSLDMIGDGLVSISVDQAAFNASLVNAGTIQADGGTVLLKASSANALFDTVINTSGVIRAMSLVERNGEIILDAGPNGGIVASGEMQAGEVSISGGSFHLQRLVSDPMLLNGLIAAQQIDITLTGAMTVDSGQVLTQTGQRIAADSLAVRAENGGFATLRNESGNQVITVTGADGLRIEGLNGGGATIQNQSGQQIITASGAGGIHVEATNGNGGAPGSAILGTPFFFGGPPATDSQQITATRINVRGGSIQANEQDIRVSGDLSLRNGAVSTNGGNQAITVTGGNVDLRDGSISSGAAQSITVTGGDHISVVGEAGFAGLQASFGPQTVSITGTGANAIRLGSATATGNSTVNGLNQTITAGNAGESGSITITGSNGGGGATHFANIGGVGVANPQTLRTSGTLSVTGGTATQGRGAAGIFQNNPAEQRISAANVVLQGSSTGPGNGAFINSTFGGGQVFDVPGELRVSGGTGGQAGIFNGTNTPLPGTTTPNTNSAPQTINAGSVVLRGAAGGSGNVASINSTFGGNQTLAVSGEIRITGGDGGTNNGAGILTNANQTINGNPDIILTGGAGGALNASNNVQIRTTGDDTKLQSIHARTIELRAGAGTDASATLNAARQVISTTGNVSLFGGAGPGGSNGVRIGGIGGTTLGPTNLTLTVGGDLLLSGGSMNGASLGSSGASTQSNNITVNASGNVTLESQGAGARIGSSNQVPVPSGSIAVTAGGNLVLGNGTAVRANGPITLTANSLTNDGTITNGGGASNMILIANAFDLAGSSIQGGSAGVFLRPRDGTRALAIEAAGDPAVTTTLTNADIAAISTSNFIGFGSGLGTNFTGDIAIGQTAQVNAGGKNLVFFRSSDPTARLGTVTIGTHGVASTGDVIVSAGRGSIVSQGGAVAGDEIQLRASQGIGTSGQRVNTAANALTMGTSGDAFVTEANDVTLRTIVLDVGGNTVLNTTNTSTGGMLDLTVGGGLDVAGPVSSAGAMTLDVGGALNVGNAVLSSAGGQAITAQSVNVTAQGGSFAQIANNTFGPQVITAGTVDVQTLAGGGTAEIRNNSAGPQMLTVTGDHLNVHGLGGGSALVIAAGGNQTIDMIGVTGKRITLGSEQALGGSSIRAGGNQLITGNADIVMTGGSGPVQDGANALILVFNPGATQTINAGTLALANSSIGGNNSVAAINGANQAITTTGNVTLTANASGGSLPGVRIGGLGGGGGSATATNLTLNVGGDLILTGGTLASNGVGIGSTATADAPPLANNITINAVNGDVILNSGVAGSGVRIGAPQTDGGMQSGGNIAITAGGEIRLNGVDEFASIRTRDTVTLGAASITEAAQGRIIAGSLSTATSGNTLLTGPNQVVVYTGTSGADLTFSNTAALHVAGINATAGTATLTADGAMTISGTVAANGVVLTANGVLDEVGGGAIAASSLTTFSTGDTSLNGANQVAVFNATSTGGDVSLANTGALDVTGMSAFGDATIANLGTVTVSGPWTAGGTSTITVGSDILLRSAMQSHDVLLVSTTGAIEQDAGASITAETLTTSSLTDTVLAGTNVVETVSVSSTEGDVSVKTAAAVLKLNDVSLSGALLVDNTGAVEVTGHVSALAHDIRATGDVTVGGANADAATLLYAPGFITIATPGSISVHGSDTTAGAGSAVVAGGALRFEAGEVSIRGGGALLTPALVRGSVVDMTVERLNVTGGRGNLSPAWLLSGGNINLTVGDAVRLQTGSGLLSWAKVQTETRDGEIRMTFPSRAEGGYFVDGIEGGVKHGQTGFYTLLKPVKVGDTLILEYGAE